MTESAAVIAVGLMVLYVAIRGYTVRALTQLRTEYQRLVSEERRLRQERQQTEILLESAVARRDQARSDGEKFALELRDLEAQIEETEEQLFRARPEDAGDSQEGAQAPMGHA